MILPVHNVTGTRCTICVYVLVMYNMCLCASQLLLPIFVLFH